MTNYSQKLKDGKAADLATLAAHGVNLPNSTDAVVLHNAAKVVQAIAANAADWQRIAEQNTARLDAAIAQRDDLAESLDYMLRHADAQQPRDLRAGSGYHIARARLAKVRK